MKFTNTFLCFLLSLSCAFGQIPTTWSGASDSNWANAANWTNGVPAAGKPAIILPFTLSGRMPTVQQPLNINFDVMNSGTITFLARTENHGEFRNLPGGFIHNHTNFYNYGIFANRAVFENNCLGLDTTNVGFINAPGGKFSNFSTVVNRAKFIIGTCSTAYFDSPTKAKLAGDIRLLGLAYILQGTVDFTTQTGTALFDPNEIPMPSASAKNATVQLDPSGHATITPELVNDESSTPYCGTPVLAISKASFDCANVGENLVTLTVTDTYGRTATTQATITVLASPICFCQPLSSAGLISGTQNFCPGTQPAPIIGLNNPNGGSGTYQFQWQKTTTNPALGGTWTDIPGATGADYQMGNITQTTWYRRLAWDAGCTMFAVVTNVQQVIAQDPMPHAVCVGGIIVMLPPNAPAVVTAAQIDGGSVAGCSGIASMSLSRSSFSSAGLYPVSLLVASPSGDVAVCTTTVDVRIPPSTSSLMPHCPTTNVQVVSTGASGAPVTYTFPAISTNCAYGSGATYTVLSGLPSGSVFPVGETQVCYKATDVCGTAATCCFTVKVMSTSSQVWTDTKVNGCVTVKVIDIATNSAGQNVYSFEAKTECKWAISYIAFSLPPGVKAVSPANGATVIGATGRRYSVENTTKNPFYCIKFNSVDNGVANGQKEIYTYTLPAGTPRMTSIMVSVKCSTVVTTLTLKPVLTTVFNLTAPKFAMQLSAFPLKGHVRVNFQSKIAKSVDEYRIQRSSDDQNWETIGTKPGGGEDGQISYYSFLDLDPLPGENHYRIQARLRLGLDWETESVLVRLADAANFSVFPNPALDKLFLDLSEFEGKAVQVTLSDVNGRILRTVEVQEATQDALQMEVYDLPSGPVSVQVASEGLVRNRAVMIGLR